MPAGPARLGQVKVGDIRILYLPDGYCLLEPTAFFPNSSPDRWKVHSKWLDHQGRLVATFGGFLIETGGQRLLVDLGFGDKEVDFPGFGPFYGGALLESLSAVGLTPGDIDAVVYTHLHLDHVGWSTRVLGHARLPTFPRARYLMAQAEWQHWYGKDDPAGPGVQEVQRPLESRVEWVEDGQAIAPGVNVLATPGHTPGHVALVVSSGGERAILFGDVMHCPVQLDETEWTCFFDVDPKKARETRERVWRELESPATIGAAPHFSDFVFGRLVLAQGRRQWSVVA